MRPLRFGLFMQPVHDPDEHPTLALERDLELLEHVDRLGFDEAWIGEHHSTGWETIASPAVFVAVASQRTRHLRLGSGIVPLPLHHPLVVADEWVLLDHLTRGRVMLGVGPGGGLPTDPLVFGLDPAEQPGRFIEAFDTIMRLFADPEPLTEDRGWYRLREATLQLRPYTQPHPEMAIVTGSNTDALERIGRHGLRWLVGTPPDRFDEAWAHVERGAAAAGRPADRSVATLPVTVHLAGTRAAAMDAVREGSARERYDFSTPISGLPEPEAPRERWVEHLAGRPTVVIGTPDDAVEKLGALLDATGAGGLLLTTKEWAGRREILDSYELFARHVIPALTGLPAGPRAADAAARRLME
ncbi:MAG: LLM class flavin-dependent oxidoreductase [Acidimicrobiia bacterium]|nr:LLM class flavin-dependent oxidoreductase [Acidimicrobiia bacterium]